MEITSGLFDNMVLQRDPNDVCDALFSGQCSYSGTVLARVKEDGVVLDDVDGVVVGKSQGSKIRGRLKDLHVGGPYDIELWVVDKRGMVCDRVRIRNVLVGDVWVLGGQSNMQGCGRMDVSPEPEDNVRAFFMDDRWGVARELLHDFHITVDPVHIDLMDGVRPPATDVITVGPGMFFAKEMFRQLDVPQGLIPCAHGGTSMAQWDPKLKKQGGRSLYGAMLRKVKKNGFNVAGLLWYQGESDATAEPVAMYTKRMVELIKNVRKDFGKAKLPVSIVQISRVVDWAPADVPHWNSIQEQQRLLPSQIRHCTIVPTIDLPLGDSIHLSAAGQERLGKRLVYATRSLIDGRAAGEPPIEPGKIEVRKDPVSGMVSIVINFKNVVGQLQSGDRPSGFNIADAALPGSVYRVDLDGDKAVLCTAQMADIMTGGYVHYGAGHNPYCNIIDEADRSLPVLGPILVGKPRAVTEFVTQLKVSRFFPSAGKLASLKYPKSKTALELEDRQFPDNMLDIHLETPDCKYKDPLVYFAAKIKCSQRMQLKVWLGYDGPVRVWIDRKEVFYDPDGTNPANVDEVGIPFLAGKGRHEVLVALGTSKKNAWGIMLRFERLGLSKKALKDPGKITLPEIIGVPNG